MTTFALEDLDDTVQRDKLDDTYRTKGDTDTTYKKYVDTITGYDDPGYVDGGYLDDGYVQGGGQDLTKQNDYMTHDNKRASMLYELPETVSLEEFKLTEFQTSFNSAFSYFNKMVINKPLEFFKNNFTSVGMAVKKVNTHHIANLDKFTVYTPEGMTGFFIDYLNVIQLNLAPLLDIETRLVDPILNWVQSNLNDKYYVNKLWPLVTAKTINLEKSYTQLKTVIDGSVNDQTVVRSIKVTYRTANEIQDCSKLLTDLHDSCLIMLNNKLNEKLTKIYTLTKELINNKEFNQYLKDPKVLNKVQQVNLIIAQAAKEIELLSVLIFQVNLAITAHDNNIKKINDSL